MNWIKDKFPEIGVRVIVECEKGRVTSAEYTGEDIWIEDFAEWEIEVSQWIPMPK